MPNRIIKETICTSEDIDSLTPELEVFFYRLMVVCDDFGLMDARPAIIKARCYPLKSIDIKRIQLNLDSLVRVNLISTYFVDGKPYLHITNWEKHQQIRAKRAKFPLPSQSDSTCNQLISDAPVIQSNPIQSKSESSIAASDESLLAAEVIRIPVRGGEYIVREDFVSTLEDAYPIVDVPQTLKEIKAWCIANPAKQKTPSGAGKFINAWCARIQNNG